MGVPLQVEDLLFNIDRKNKERDDASHVGRRAISGITAQIRPNPRRGGAKVRHFQVSRLGMILQAKMNLQGLVATTLHQALHSHHTNALWQEVNQVSHPLVMIVMMNVMVRKSPPYTNLCMPLSFLGMFALNNRLNLKL
jgi:3-dehydroquinate dehydratase